MISSINVTDQIKEAGKKKKKEFNFAICSDGKT